MASISSVLKTLINIKNFVWEDADIKEHLYNFNNEEVIKKEIHINARPYKREGLRCPVCHKKCSKYDSKHTQASSVRAGNFNGFPVYIDYSPKRISCSKHGVLTENIPWKDGNSRFTADFNNEVAWLSTQMSKTAISTYLGINWRTVGNCIKCALDRIEPDIEDRIHSGVKRICVDETSYRKGHSYITVVYDMDRNCVIWIKENHGESIFSQFCELLTEEERNAIEIVAGDGARWIDTCTRKYFPNAHRCIDFFHVVSWANEMIDDVRTATAAKARREYNTQKKLVEEEENERQEKLNRLINSIKELKDQLAKFPKKGRPSAQKKAAIEMISVLEKELQELQPDEPKTVKRGRPRKESFTEESIKKLEELKANAERIKGSKYALTKNPEHRTANQDDMLEYIFANCPDLRIAWEYKELLRIVLHMKDPELAEKKLDEWITDTSSSKIKAISTLSEKILRHKENILNSVRYQANSAKSEATNTSIKTLIKMARGFRNLENMFALIYLKCSDITIPLTNRPQLEAAAKARKREHAMLLKRARDDEKMQFVV